MAIPRWSRIRADILRKCKFAASSIFAIHISTFLLQAYTYIALLAVGGSFNVTPNKPLHRVWLCRTRTPCHTKSAHQTSNTSCPEHMKTLSPTTRKLYQESLSMDHHMRAKAPTRRERLSSSKIYASSHFALYVHVIKPNRSPATDDE
jgi:hypothetical protein